MVNRPQSGYEMQRAPKKPIQRERIQSKIIYPSINLQIQFGKGIQPSLSGPIVVRQGHIVPLEALMIFRFRQSLIVYSTSS
jgi:hypothetical protein